MPGAIRTQSSILATPAQTHPSSPFREKTRAALAPRTPVPTRSRVRACVYISDYRIDLPFERISIRELRELTCKSKISGRLLQERRYRFFVAWRENAKPFDTNNWIFHRISCSNDFDAENGENERRSAIVFFIPLAHYAVLMNGYWNNLFCMYRICKVDQLDLIFLRCEQ